MRIQGLVVHMIEEPRGYVVWYDDFVLLSYYILRLCVSCCDQESVRCQCCVLNIEPHFVIDVTRFGVWELPRSEMGCCRFRGV